ncbi:RNA polymerase sigma factor [Intestinimonas butyriciproducens]|mgnify:FL=1|uniref:RNA polymerase sigma factor n=1 Tax=Intestinimonas butyriciproducens TaxID=1297617 RepID=UPI00195BE942|nr:sigma-70 family RNA polymerase sigma factor [Intestinimonas butyriciproducens]MBM6975506.1 sigma-70 family RNA polymerase sigma factor [Intestinimonas butyriciproducens]
MKKSAPDNRQLLVEHILNGQTDFYRLAVSYVKNRDAALDVVQEAIVKALSKVDTVREPAYLKTWFYRILINEAMNHFRRNRNLVSLEEVMVDRAVESGDPGERLDLYDAIDRLSFQEQTVIKLRYFEDMKLEEIAQATGANLNTVKSRLYKAIRKLKDMTGEEIDYAP